MRLDNIKFKDNIFFHGASNDKGRDPDKMKISPPSPEHPFFITQSMELAYQYSQIPTGKNGRITTGDEFDGIGGFDSNARIYIIRLVKNLNQLKNVTFHFDNPTEVSKLGKYFGKKFVDAINKIYKDSQRKITISSIATKCALLISSYRKYFKDLIQSDDDKKQEIINAFYNETKGTFTLPDGTIKTIGEENLEYIEIIAGISQYLPEILQSHPKNINRREIKSVLFKQIKNEGYKIVAEKNTFTRKRLASDMEYAIIDMSIIKDICPFPITQNVMGKVIQEFYNISDDEYKDNLSGKNMWINTDRIKFHSKIVDTERFISILNKYI